MRFAMEEIVGLRLVTTIEPSLPYTAILVIELSAPAGASSTSDGASAAVAACAFAVRRLGAKDSTVSLCRARARSLSQFVSTD